MALTRKFLTALGIEADKIDEIVNAHSETVEALKEERDSYKKDAEKLPELQKQLDEANDTIKSNKSDAYKVKYDAIKEEFDKFKKDQSDKEVKSNKMAAYKQLLTSVGVSEKRLDAILKVTDLDSVELDDDGKIKDAKTLADNIKDEWSDFIVQAGQQGAKTSTPPASSGASMTKEQIVAIKDPAERRAAIAQNMEIFNGGK